MRTFHSLIMLLCCGTLLVSCQGGDSRPDPKEAYADLVKAAQAGDGGKMYDYLDSSFRGQVDQMVQMQSQFSSQMSPEDKAKWDQIAGKKGRDAFAKMVELNREQMTSRFKGDYKVSKIDTIVVMTVEHTGQQPDLLYLRWENGRWAVTQPPQPPQPAQPQGQMPQGHPEVAPPPQGAPSPQTAPQQAPGGDTSK